MKRLSPKTAKTASQGKLTRIDYPDSPRLVRVRVLARLMDQSIRLPNGWRIGIDPLIGLVPVIGDFIGLILSGYIIYEGARLGLRIPVLARMCGNVLLESLAGAIPLLGDLFDAAWKANVRNCRLIETHHRPSEKERTGLQTALIFLAPFVVMAVATVAAAIWILKWLISLMA